MHLGERWTLLQVNSAALVRCGLTPASAPGLPIASAQPPKSIRWEGLTATLPWLNLAL
jgi:hypothetical protein